MNNKGRRSRRAAWRLAAAALVCLSAAAAAAKPGPPLALSAKVVEVDPATHCVRVEIAAQSFVKTDSLAIRCELPPGAAIVPGSSEWTQDSAGRRVLSLSVATPRDGGKLVVRASALGEGVKTGSIAALDLPPAAAQTPRPEPAARILKTSTGEQLRLHGNER